MAEVAERVWPAGNARESLADIIEGAIAGTPQVVQRNDGEEVVVVSRDYYECTRPSLKAHLLAGGYADDSEDAFDGAIRDIRDGPPWFAPRDLDFSD
jgi:PHD/YefM family antitoxin component YafN of YafNO toxin-antitoxin module